MQLKLLYCRIIQKIIEAFFYPTISKAGQTMWEGKELVRYDLEYYITMLSFK